MNTDFNNLIPENIFIERSQHKLLIRYRWFTWKLVIPLLVLSILSFTIVPLYVRGAIETGAWIFPIILAPWFIFVVYYLVVKIINYSLISADRQDIKILHRPLPLEKNIALKINQVKNIVITEKTNQGRSLRTYYDVEAVVVPDKKIRLLKNISNYNQAKFIADELQRAVQQT